MWRWLRRTPKKAAFETEPLKGAPVRARKKTYSAETGYVYEYVYKGFRILASGAEFVFQATRSAIPVTFAILLRNEALHECETCIGRELSAAERYAIAKMALFAAFDEAADPAQLECNAAPNREAMLEHLRALGRI